MLSTVIPVFNEVESLESLYRELHAVAEAEGYELDLVLVDDGSTDGSWQTIASLAANDPRVRGIRFRRNFGKAAALSAGFRAAQGDLVMTLD
ncbi:MAG TPA: glycosyltransferase, partial [Pirellulales bacterium]